MSNVGIVKKSPKNYQTTEGKPLMVVNEKEVNYSYSFNDTIAYTPRSAQNLIQQSRQGLPIFRIEIYMNKYGLTLKEIATILNLSERTLQRYESTDLLSKEASDRALHLQRLYERGEEVFGSLEKFKGWMKSPILVLNNDKPISFLDTIFGFELIEQELGRIEHGVFA